MKDSESTGSTSVSKLAVIYEGATTIDECTRIGVELIEANVEATMACKKILVAAFFASCLAFFFFSSLALAEAFALLFLFLFPFLCLFECKGRWSDHRCLLRVTVLD